jgi:hypothetical protein
MGFATSSSLSHTVLQSLELSLSTDLLGSSVFKFIDLCVSDQIVVNLSWIVKIGELGFRGF